MDAHRAGSGDPYEQLHRTSIFQRYICNRGFLRANHNRDKRWNDNGWNNNRGNDNTRDHDRRHNDWRNDHWGNYGRDDHWRHNGGYDNRRNERRHDDWRYDNERLHPELWAGGHQFCASGGWHSVLLCAGESGGGSDGNGCAAIHHRRASPVEGAHTGCAGASGRRPFCPFASAAAVEKLHREPVLELAPPRGGTLEQATPSPASARRRRTRMHFWRRTRTVLALREVVAERSQDAPAGPLLLRPARIVFCLRVSAKNYSVSSKTCAAKAS